MMNMSQYDLIEQVARELYVKSGKVEGHDLDNCLEAESIVKGRREGDSEDCVEALYEEDFPD